MTKVGLLLFIILTGIVTPGKGQVCTREGFFRNPDDCSKFYRCIDLWQNGQRFGIFNFNCPVGTVFDENYMVCNWAFLAPSCLGDPPIEDLGTETSHDTTWSNQDIENEMMGPENALGDVETTEPVVAEVESVPGNTDEAVVLTPSFNYQCNAEGLFEHADDCRKFWACELYDGGEIGGQLYVCPDNYWFDGQLQRCARKDLVKCTKQQSLTQSQIRQQGIKLQVSDIDGFFARYSNYFP